MWLRLSIATIPEEYVRIVCEEMIPAVAEGAREVSPSSRSWLSSSMCSASVERSRMQQSQRILRAAVDHGLGVRVHVCQLTPAKLGAAA